MSAEPKTLILTGASRGIGHATVKRFSDEGWRIVTCTRGGRTTKVRALTDAVG